jgi:pyruvate,water dikinase
MLVLLFFYSLRSKNVTRGLVVAFFALFRRRALTIGEELVREGRIDAKEQIFDMTLDQVALVEGGGDGEDVPNNLRPWIESNTHQSKLVEHVTNWPTLIDSRGKIIRGTQKPKDNVSDGNFLMGDPIAPGIVRGKAKVLLEPYEKPLESGEVLVARFTEPSWTPIFINASAVVMEVGGPLQHGAVIAREYGIPCVSGLQDATTLIQDGDVVEVDGSSGTVRFLQRTS